MSDQEIPEKPADPFSALSNEGVRIVPPNIALKEVLGKDFDIKAVLSPENVEKAQQLINDHKDEFLAWVRDDIGQLRACYDRIAADQTLAASEMPKLAHMAFVIKSQAGTFGFSLATRVAKSLDDFCAKHFRIGPDHLVVVEKHIDTLTLIFTRNIVGDGGEVGQQLLDILFKLVDRFKAR